MWALIESLFLCVQEGMQHMLYGLGLYIAVFATTVAISILCGCVTWGLSIASQLTHYECSGMCYFLVIK